MAACTLLWTVFAGAGLPAVAASEPPIERAGRIAVAVARSHAARRFKTWLRGKVVKPQDLAGYGLVFEPVRTAASSTMASRPATPADKPFVVFVHGYNSSPKRNRTLIAAIRRAGYESATFRYPNDHGVAASGMLLAKELAALARQQPNRRVALVTHSMGGLVARACVENPALDPGNVDKLIMIAPPSHGTILAHFAHGTDVWEHAFRRGGGGPIKRIRASIVDGLAEAVDDLRPGSPFLRELNARPRNPDIEYSILLGVGALMTEAERETLRRWVHRSIGKLPFFRAQADEIGQWIADMDEVITGKGDGVVAVDRGRLAGVDDVTLIPFRHLSVTSDARSPVVRTVHRAILARLGGTP